LSTADGESLRGRGVAGECFGDCKNGEEKREKGSCAHFEILDRFFCGRLDLGIFWTKKTYNLQVLGA